LIWKSLNKLLVVTFNAKVGYLQLIAKIKYDKVCIVGVSNWTAVEAGFFNIRVALL
jgi:hypothetical protein